MSEGIAFLLHSRSRDITASMSKRYYYNDSYTTHFDATVIERLTVNEAPAVILNGSYFYPTSGGQPHDRGMISDATVVDVFVRETDQAVVHVLDNDVSDDSVTAQIDWARRFDLMQQHTGQHILSAAFFEIANALTVGFHLGADSCTIDLAISRLDGGQIARAEELANQVVWENRPITPIFIPKSDIPNYPLRKVPNVPGDELRLVIIENFDYNACGGTHVRGTADVGLIKINKVERVRGQVRVEFRCGQRALRDYAQKETIINQLASDLTCAIEDLPHNIGNLRKELKVANKRLKKQGNLLLQIEAQKIADNSVDNLVVQIFARRDANELRQLANAVARLTDSVVLLGAAGNPATIALAKSKNAQGDMNAILQQLLAQTGGTGGGSATFASGGGFKAAAKQLEALFSTVEI